MADLPVGTAGEGAGAARLLGPGRLRRGGPALGRPADARRTARGPERLPAGAEQPAVPARAVGRGGRGDAGAGVPAGRGGVAPAVGLRVRAGEGPGAAGGPGSGDDRAARRVAAPGGAVRRVVAGASP